MSNSARRARTLLLAAVGAILLGGLSGCMVRGGYGCGPFLFEVGWNAVCPGGHGGGGCR